MTIELNVHEAGCVPFRRCRACRAADIAGEHLPEDMRVLLVQGKESAPFEPGVHLPGCSPLNPCAMCVCIGKLKRNLGGTNFNKFIELIEGGKSIDEIELESDPEYLELRRKLSLSVDIFRLSARTANCLRNDSILLLSDLCSKTESELLRIPTFGRKSLNEIKEELSQLGLRLGMDVPAGIETTHDPVLR